MKINIPKFLAWHATLTDIDKMNFNSVVAMKLAGKLPPSAYRDMAEFATNLMTHPEKIAEYEKLKAFLDDE